MKENAALAGGAFFLPHHPSLQQLFFPLFEFPFFVSATVFHFFFSF
jgi:hypothetical protein